MALLIENHLPSTMEAGGTFSAKPFGIAAGYGAGGAVTQATSRSTGVTLNTICGTITGNATSLAANASASFVVTNSQVAIRDVVTLSVVSGPTADTSVFSVSATAAGSFTIRIANVSTTTADTGAPIINFIVTKAANS
jgi:hypothetical protein